MLPHETFVTFKYWLAHKGIGARGRLGCATLQATGTHGGRCALVGEVQTVTAVYVHLLQRRQARRYKEPARAVLRSDVDSAMSRLVFMLQSSPDADSRSKEPVLDFALAQP